MTDRLAFVFSGHGSQWPGMGRGLFAEPAFCAAIERWEEAIQRHGGWSLLRALEAPASVSRLGEVDVAQPAIVALEVALGGAEEGVRAELTVCRTDVAVSGGPAGPVLSGDPAALEARRARLAGRG